jgi:hypothetical protein
MLAASISVLAMLGPPANDTTVEAGPEYAEIVSVAPPAEPDPLPAEPSIAAEPSPEPAPPKPEPAPDVTVTAAPEPQPPPTWQAEIFVDIYYAYNSNSPDNHLMRGFITTPRSSEIVPNVVGGFIRHPATDQEPWWIEIGLHAGPGVDSMVQAEPIAGGEHGKFAGVEVYKHIALANAGFLIRKTKTTIGAGVLESPFGLSSFWSFRNTTYTPMWQNNIVPYYFAGARISQEIPGGLRLSAWVVNGSQTYSDKYKIPSGVASLSYSPPPRKGMQALTLNSHVLFGPERESAAPEDWYILWDTTLWYAPVERFAMGAAWDYAIENPGRARELQNVYTGGGLLARGNALERENVGLHLVGRFDVLLDREGHYFGVPQWLFCPLAGADLRLWEGLTLRVQYRYDYSTNEHGFFYRREMETDDSPMLARDQHTIHFALVGLWDFWFGRRKRPK